jgi:hypothetical protein
MIYQITNVSSVQRTSTKIAISTTIDLSLMVLELASSAKNVRSGLQLWIALNPMSAQPQIARGKVIRKPRSSIEPITKYSNFSLKICWPGAVGTF